MHLRISATSTNNSYNILNSITFNGFSRKSIRYTGYALIAATMLASSCLNKTPKVDTIELTETKTDNNLPEITDSMETEGTVKNFYHYFPKNNNIINNEVPDWTEKIYPDGSAEIDSFEYKISISPDGKRTTIKTATDSSGNTIVTTDFPDSTKTVKINYLTQNPNEIFLVEKNYRSNGKLKASTTYREYPSDSVNITSSSIIEQQYRQYNENEVLIYWNNVHQQHERNDSNNVYDSYNRLIYDSINNENFYYKDSDRIPFKSVSLLEDCKRIILYNDSGYVEKIYFEASDGTITEK